MVISFDTLSACDGQTDGQTDMHANDSKIATAAGNNKIKQHFVSDELKQRTKL